MVQPFTDSVGPCLILPSSPVGIFRLFFTASILEYITEQTNLYASQCMSTEEFQSWEIVTVAELEAFFGFMILMGIVQLPSLLDYWSKDATYYYSPIAGRISRTRFFEIQKYLHFADNTTLSPPGTLQYNR